MGALESELLSPKEACEYLGICRRSLGRYMATGVIPEPLRLSARMLRWRKKDLDRAMEERSKTCQRV